MDIGVKSHQKYQQTHINTTFKELYTMIIVEVAMIKAITRKNTKRQSSGQRRSYK